MRKCSLEQDEANRNCTCEPGERKGVCCECLEYDRRSGELPGCSFADDVERTDDCSVEGLIETCRKRRWSPPIVQNR